MDTRTTPSNHISPEKKIELAQYIRAENADNRMRIRQREQILYGTATQAQPSLYDRGTLARPDIASEEVPPQITMVKGTFKLRMFLAVLLFVGFLICDTNNLHLFQYSMADIDDMIVADTFHLQDGGSSALADGFAGLLDFK